MINEVLGVDPMSQERAQQAVGKLWECGLLETKGGKFIGERGQ